MEHLFLMNSNLHLTVKDIIGSEIAVTTDDGNILYENINKAFLKDDTVELDFAGIKILITAFLNSAIGRLYENYDSKFLNENLKLINVAPEDRILFKKVVERAQEYFNDKKGFEDSANNAF
ncbi:STAS-like domain-containing protein [Elizabethkingia anophelis]|uniref:STAS-like domain-containing protein n=1 Tax=Elizabethkingia anophelis TaxID=1117645 RepID=UPI00389288D9